MGGGLAPDGRRSDWAWLDFQQVIGIGWIKSDWCPSSTYPSQQTRSHFRARRRSEREHLMEGGETERRPGAARYALQPGRLMSEDVLFCVDVDAESSTEMKLAGPGGRPVTRLDSVRQALLLFVHAKLHISPDHRFAFSLLAQSASWLRKEFSNDLDSVVAAVRQITASDLPYGLADLTQLFRMATHEAKKSREQNRLLRVILIYCRSSTRPQHQWPVSQKLFTLDVIYLHDKPGPDNCPQKVFDALVNTLDHVSEYEGYILESGHGLSRTLFRMMCILLSHPQQRCVQEDLDIPKPLKRKSPPPSDSTPTEESISISSQ